MNTTTNKEDQMKTNRPRTPKPAPDPRTPEQKEADRQANIQIADVLARQAGWADVVDACNLVACEISEAIAAQAGSGEVLMSAERETTAEAPIVLNSCRRCGTRRQEERRWDLCPSCMKTHAILNDHVVRRGGRS